MYFAQMYCYGDSNDIVGISGIRNCMGAVYVGNNSMYAIHIPFAAPDNWRMAAQTFSNFVSNNGGKTGRKGYLYGFVNGKNNSYSSKDLKNCLSAEEEIAIIKKGLGSPAAALYRINEHLGKQSGGMGADAVAIMVKRIHATSADPSGTAIFYKRDAEIDWVAGGDPPTGQYKTATQDKFNVQFGTALVPSDLVGIWRRATTQNCTVTKI